MAINEPPIADDSPTPRETILAMTLGQIRQFLREKRPIELVLAWRVAGGDPHVVVKVDRLKTADTLIAAALIKIERVRRRIQATTPLCEVSEMEDEESRKF